MAKGNYSDNRAPHLKFGSSPSHMNLNPNASNVSSKGKGGYSGASGTAKVGPNKVQD